MIIGSCPRPSHGVRKDRFRSNADSKSAPREWPRQRWGTTMAHHIRAPGALSGTRRVPIWVGVALTESVDFATHFSYGLGPQQALGGTGLGWERKGRCAAWGLTRTAEGLSAEPDLVGALEVFDEGVGTEGGVLASGTAEVGGFAASQGGEALLPMAGVGQRCWNW